MKNGFIFASILVLTSCGQSDGPASDSAEATQDNDSSSISLDEFGSVKIGMSYDEAIKIVGGEGAVVSETDSGGYHTIAYRFDGIGEMGANGNLVFQNGKLINKSQFGLK